MRKAIKIPLIVLCVIVGLIVVVALAAYLFLTFYPSVGKMPDSEAKKLYEEIAENFYDGEFHNENAFEVMTGKQQETSDRQLPENKIESVAPDISNRAKDDKLTVTWFGHSSSLIQLGAKNILIDPVLGERSSPVGFVGPKRFSNCPVTVDSLPDIDVLFISHDHYDHLEYETIKEIDGKVGKYIVPLGVDFILKGWGVSPEKIYALGWWDEIEIEGVDFTLTPAQHYTGRNPLKANSTLWGGLYMSNGVHNVYYTGDTGYYDVFSRIYEKFGVIDLMLADSGQYDTGWATTHMNPEEAISAAQDAHADWLLPVHWGAFSLANHAWDDPIIRAYNEAAEKSQNLVTPRIGQTVDFDSVSEYTEKWWEKNTTGTAKTTSLTESSQSTASEEPIVGKNLTLTINGQRVSVEWEDNDSVEALKDLVKDEPLTIQMSMYGGFEQVGSIGTSLPRDDVQTTTEAGDIVLYSGNQIVVFYGSNSWAYTRLGHITDKTAAQMKDLLGNGNVTIELSAE